MRPIPPRKKLYVILPWMVAALLLTGCTLSNLAPTPAVPEARAVPTETASATATATLGPEELMAAAIDAGNGGDWAGALTYLDQVLAANPEDARGYLLRGNAHAALGINDLAEADYSQALSLDSNLAAAYYGRAVLRQATGQTETALDDFSAAIEVEPSYALAYKGRADLQEAQGNYAAAEVDLEVYLTLLPNAPDRGDIEARIAALQRQAESAVDDGDLLYSDDFSDPNSGWYSNGAEDAEMGYAEDGYRITVNAAAAGAWAYSGQVFANARLEVVAEKVGGPEDSNWFGLLCRVQTDADAPSFYAFIISSDGYYGIGKRVNGGGLELLNAGDMQFSSAVIKGEASNLIAAECAGDRLTLFVNGVKVAEVTDSDLEVGQASLIVGTFAEPGASVIFDDFAAYAVSP